MNGATCVAAVAIGLLSPGLTGCATHARKGAGVASTQEVGGPVDDALSTEGDLTPADFPLCGAAVRFAGPPPWLLLAFDEPSLAERSGRRPVPVIYRFVWKRTFDAPIAVRVTIQKDLAIVTVKATDGLGGYGAGDLMLDDSRQLSAEEARELSAAVEAEGFWALPEVDTDCAPVVADGATWWVEGARPAQSPLDRGEYHSVVRRSPVPGPMRRLGLLFLRLARLEIPPGRVY